jgi:hypothetical protein
MATTIPVTAQRYNDLRDLVNKILGLSVTATPTYGYGETFSTSSVTGDYDTNLSSTDKVSAIQYENLYIDIIRIKAHQVGTSALTVDPFVIGEYDTNLTSTDKIELAYVQALESLASDIETDKFEIDVTGQAQVVDLKNSSGVAIESERLNSGNGAWNGTISHIFQISFNTAQERRQFFNAGGQVRFSARVAYTGSQPKTVDWQTEMSDMGVTSFRATDTINNNSEGTGSAIGNFDLTGTYKLCYSKGGGASYVRNDYRISALSPSDTTIRFKVEFNDNQPNDLTWGIDEPVYGDFYSTIELLQPIGVVDINGTEYDTINIPDNELPTGITLSNL